MDKQTVVYPYYQFPTTAVTNYQKLGGLEQNRFILLHFRRPEVLNLFHGLESKHWQGYFLPEALKEELTSSPSSASSAHLYSLACGPFLCLHRATLQSLLLSSQLPGSFGIIFPPPDPYSITSIKPPLLYKVTVHGCGYLWESLFSLPYNRILYIKRNDVLIHATAVTTLETG